MANGVEEGEEQVRALAGVRAKIHAAELEFGRKPGSTTLIAVSKTYDGTAIGPVIEAGQHVFGENRVQEAQAKWPALRKSFAGMKPCLELHLIGPLQSNKAADAVALFDVIQTVDREKIAAELAREMKQQKRFLPVYVQVNTGLEAQKAGVAPAETVAFVARCRAVHGLDVEGLMCIPPAGQNPGPHFALLRKLAREAGAEKLSMGMSGDYETAIQFGATSVRVGSAIFGAR